MQLPWSYNVAAGGSSVASMVTRIHKHARARYYPKEHRNAKHLTAKQVAERLGINEKSVYRIEKHPWRLDREAKRDEWAEALGLESGEDLKRPPHVKKRPSLDAEVKDVSDEVYEMVYDVVKRMAAGGRR